MEETEARTLANGLDWLATLSRLESVEYVARDILDAPNDPRRNEATEILKIADRVRRAFKRGWTVPAGEMLQLGQLTASANIKVIAPLVEESTKRRAGFQRVAAPANYRRHSDAEAQHAAWRRAADSIWARHPDWSASAVAGRIAREQGGNANTIRRKLSRPSKP